MDLEEKMLDIDTEALPLDDDCPAPDEDAVEADAVPCEDEPLGNVASMDAYRSVPESIRALAKGNAKRMSAIIREASENGEQGAANLFKILGRDRFCYDAHERTWFRFTSRRVWVEDLVKNVLAETSAIQAVFDVEKKLLRQSEEAYTSNAVEKQRKACEARNEPFSSKDEEAIRRKTEKKYAKVIKALDVQIACLNTLRYQRNVIELAAIGEDSLGYEGLWDCGDYLLPCKNGVAVDLQTGAVRDIHPRDHIRTTTNADYDPDARCDRFERFLQEVLPSEDTRRLVCKVVGYSLCKDPIEHKLIVLNGSGRNGKNVLTDTLKFVLGKVAAIGDPSLLVSQGRAEDPNAAKPAVMALKGRGPVFMSELPEGARWNEDKVKSMTGDGYLQGRELYAKKEEFPATHTLIMLTNFLPHGSADDEALWKRILPIPFTQVFVDRPDPNDPNQHQIDTNLTKALRREKSGIQNLLISWALDWYADGFGTMPEEVERCLDEYRKGEDDISAFIEEECVFSSSAVAEVGAVYDRFRDWSGKTSLTKTAFGRKLLGRLQSRFRQHPVDKRRSNSKTVYVGLGLVTKDF